MRKFVSKFRGYDARNNFKYEVEDFFTVVGGSTFGPVILRHDKTGTEFEESISNLKKDYTEVFKVKKDADLYYIKNSLDTLDHEGLMAVKATIENHTKKKELTDKERIAELERQMELQVEVSKEMVGLLKDMTKDFNAKVKALALRGY